MFFHTFKIFFAIASLNYVWKPASLQLINMDGIFSLLRIMRPDQVVLTLFTFEIFKQHDQMVVAIDYASQDN